MHLSTKQKYKKLKIRKHNDHMIRIPVHKGPPMHTENLHGWIIGFDDTDHFQFFCPECGDVAKIRDIRIDECLTTIWVGLICEYCERSGQRKIYLNGDCSEYCTQFLEDENIEEMKRVHMRPRLPKEAIINSGGVLEVRSIQPATSKLSKVAKTDIDEGRK